VLVTNIIVLWTNPGIETKIALLLNLILSCTASCRTEYRVSYPFVGCAHQSPVLCVFYNNRESGCNSVIVTMLQDVCAQIKTGFKYTCVSVCVCVCVCVCVFELENEWPRWLRTYWHFPETKSRILCWINVAFHKKYRIPKINHYYYYRVFLFYLFFR
jgi:hypothetical protein